MIPTTTTISTQTTDDDTDAVGVACVVGNTVDAGAGGVGVVVIIAGGCVFVV